MNSKKIAKLSHKARKWAMKKSWSDCSKTYHELFQEKFAKLIVLECINALPEKTKPGAACAKRIKERFCLDV